jgi:hypothetical protein
LSIENPIYLLAAYDLNDESNFKWCKKNYSLPLKKDAKLKFAKNQPDHREDENCAAVAWDWHSNAMALSDVSCAQPFQYICEVIAIMCLAIAF